MGHTCLSCGEKIIIERERERERDFQRAFNGYGEAQAL